MPQNANSGSAFRRVGIFILAMFLGVVIFLGAVAGTVYYALNYVTVKKLSEKNIDIGADAVLTPESPLREYSVMRLFKEFSTLELLLTEKNKETATLHDFLTVYGLKVPDPVMERIPEEYKNIRIADLETRGPANAFLDATRISSPLQLAGLRAAVSDDAWNLLSARSVSLLVERKFETALAGIYLGDLTGVKLVRREGTDPEVI